MECPKCKSIKTSRNGYSIRKGIRSQLYACNNCGHRWRDFDRKSTAFRRIIFIQDTHCGHWTGLTPSEFQVESMPFADFRK